MSPMPKHLLRCLPCIAAAALACVAAPVAAQQNFLLGDPLPRDVADEIVDFLNDPSVIRFDGRATVPA